MSALSNGQDNALDNRSEGGASDPWVVMDAGTHTSSGAGSVGYTTTLSSGQLDISDSGAVTTIDGANYYVWDTGIPLSKVHSVLFEVKGLTKDSNTPQPGFAIALADSGRDTAGQKGVAFYFSSSSATTIGAQEVTDNENLGAGWANRTGVNGTVVGAFLFDQQTSNTNLSSRQVHLARNTASPQLGVSDLPNFTMTPSDNLHITLYAFNRVSGSGAGQITWTAGSLRYQVVTFEN